MRYYYKSNLGKGILNLKSPLTDLTNYTQVTEEEYNELKKSFEPSDEQKAKVKKAHEIEELKRKLSNTDYIVLKIAEATAENDTETVSALKTTYAIELAERKTWRDQINALQ